MRNPFYWAAAILLVLAAARIPANLPWCDEGWFFNPSYNLITKGHAGTTVMDAKGFPWDGIERHMYWQPPFHLLVHSAWLTIFGASLFSLRFCSLCAGLIALYLWGYVYRYSGMSPPLRTAALILVAVDYAFVRASSDGRPDLIAMALGLGAFVSYLHFRERNFSLAVFLSQTLAVCGGLTHPMGGLLYLGFIGWVFFTRRDWRRMRARDFALAAAPYLAGIAGWGAYILQEPETFRRIFFGSSIAGRMSGIFQPLLSLKREILVRFLQPYGWGRPSLANQIKVIIPFAYFTGTIAAWVIPSVRRMPHMRLILPLWSITSLTFFLFDNQRNGTYLPHLFPLSAVLVASVLWKGWESGGWLRPAAAVLFIGFALLQASGSIYVVVTNPYRNYYLPVTHFVAEHMPANSSVIATNEMGFELGFDKVREDPSLGYFTGRKPGVIVVDGRYREWFAGFRRDKPEIADFISRRLASEYRLAFTREPYEVYLLR